MIKTNMHIHSKYSFDSKMEIEDIARILVENNVRYAAITDHVEFDRENQKYVLWKLLIRNLEIEKVNEKYEGKLKLLKSVEISEPHWHQDKVEYLSEHADLDFIIGSHHNIINLETSDNREYVTYLYYKQILEMIEKGNFDVLGHLDYINRYYRENYSDFNQVKEIFEALIEHHKIIEINTSAERRAGLKIFPSIDKICRYRLVGKDVTIGTDAHRENELVDNLEQAEYLSQKIGLKPVIFQKRKLERI